ncbi:MAG: sulfite exporter TauE/SafE family protein [Verrucomicrobia bacterium]|nr:MAG: sulfite exporter TauE/SafE family protein [Verrucomicrobiota bacterium]
MTLVDLGGIVLIGLAGSGHCVGMCGGFALAVGRDASGAGALLLRHVAYQTGKALTYVFLAVLVAGGFGIVGRAAWFASAQTVLALLAGVFMGGYGLMQALAVRPAGWWRRWLEPLPGCGLFAAAGKLPGPVAALVTGWLNGFLPCGLVYAVLMHLASFYDVGGAALGAAVFGFSTLPGLLLFGALGHAWSPRWRSRLVRVAGALLVLFGVITVIRAFPEGRHWLHEEVMPAAWGTFRDWCGF